MTHPIRHAAARWLSRAAAISSLLLGSATPAQAQSSANDGRQLEISVSANTRRPDAVPSAAQQPRTQPGISVQVAMAQPGGVTFLTDVSVGRGAVRINEGSCLNCSQGTRQATFLDITGGVRVSIDRRVQPFLEILSGVSVGKASYTSGVLELTHAAMGKEGTRLLFRPGVGVDWFVGSRLGIRAQVAGLIMSTNSMVRWPRQFNVGLVIRPSPQ